MTASDIGRAGEVIAVQDLKSKGYSILKWNTQLPGSSDIEANTRRHILVQVKSAVSPNVPASLSSDELRDLKSRATKVGAEPWIARVQLDSSMQKVAISWDQLL